MTNKELTWIVAIMAALLTVSGVISFNILKDYECNAKAIHAVYEYIDITADTGQMDDFLESPEGRTFVEYSK